MTNHDRYEEDYQKNLGFEKYQIYYRRKQVLQFLSLYKPQSVLEIGCGLEPIFEFYPDLSHYTLVEPGKGFMENAKKKATGAIKSDFHTGTFESCAHHLIPNDYDCIIASSVLHEVQDPKSFLECLYRVSPFDTLIHINVSNARSFHRLMALKMGVISDLKEMSELGKTLQRQTLFDLNDLKALCCNARFQILKSGSYFLKPFTHSQMQKMLEEKMITESHLEGLNQLTNLFPDYGSEIFVEIKKI